LSSVVLTNTVQSFGYTTVKSQLMSVIVYACAFLGIIFFARMADITNKKGLTLVAAQVWTCVGYALLIGLENHKARFAACCILAFGVFANVVLILVWVMSCTPGYTQR
jgi:Na+/melibiose symporter-like transporter